ncbi:MAG: hypothetical protein KBG15_14075 [Kofleriaceae bacterium]|nr:hypothetical protein [Kofleriaceae bacterium]
MLKSLGPVIAIYVIMLLFVFPSLLYVIGRWRSGKAGDQDSQFGFKFAVCVFGSAGFQMAATGVFAFLYTLMSDIPSDFKGPVYRAAFGVLIPAVIIVAIHRMLFLKTNHREFPSVFRLFVGYNLIVFGTSGFIGFMLLFQALLMKGSSGEIGKIAGIMVFVYGGGWIFLYKVLGGLSGLRFTSGDGGAGMGGGYPPQPMGQQAYAGQPPQAMGQQPYAGQPTGPQSTGQQPYAGQPTGPQPTAPQPYAGQPVGQAPYGAPPQGQPYGQPPAAQTGANPYAPPGWDPNKK